MHQIFSITSALSIDIKFIIFFIIIIYVYMEFAIRTLFFFQWEKHKIVNISKLGHSLILVIKILQLLDEGFYRCVNTDSGSVSGLGGDFGVIVLLQTMKI